jgi:hypothetical protein
MLSFDARSSLTYSTLEIIGMGGRSSNCSLKGSFTGTYASFNSTPYGGGHIPPLPPRSEVISSNHVGLMGVPPCLVEGFMGIITI